MEQLVGMFQNMWFRGVYYEKGVRSSNPNRRWTVLYWSVFFALSYDNMMKSILQVSERGTEYATLILVQKVNLHTERYSVPGTIIKRMKGNCMSGNLILIKVIISFHKLSSLF